MDRLLTPAYREMTPLEEQLTELLEKLDLSTAMKHSPSRSKRLKLLKKTILEVRSEIGLKKSLPSPQQDKPLTPSPSEPCTPQEESLTPPTLELLTSLSQLDTAPSNPEPPPLESGPAYTPMELEADVSTSVPVDTPNGHTPGPLLLNGDLRPEAPATCSRRTNNLFRKSKSASPQKPPKTSEVSATSPPPLGAKTFLSVVIPRLETLLLPKKRRRSSSADREEEESPVKRLDTGTEQEPSQCQGVTVPPEKCDCVIT